MWKRKQTLSTRFSMIVKSSRRLVSISICHRSQQVTALECANLLISTNSTVVLSLLDGCWWYKCYEGRKNLCVLSKDQAVQQRQCINVSLGQKDQNWTSKLWTITSRMLLKELNTFGHFHHPLFSLKVSNTCSNAF